MMYREVFKIGFYELQVVRDRYWEGCMVGMYRDFVFRFIEVRCIKYKVGNGCQEKEGYCLIMVKYYGMFNFSYYCFVLNRSMQFFRGYRIIIRNVYVY